MLPNIPPKKAMKYSQVDYSLAASPKADLMSDYLPETPGMFLFFFLFDYPKPYKEIPKTTIKHTSL